MQGTIRQRRHLEYNSLRHTEPMKADELMSGDVITGASTEGVGGGVRTPQNFHKGSGGTGQIHV